MATPLPPVASSMRARLTWTLGDDINVENVLYYSLAGGVLPLTVALASALAGDISTALKTSFQASLSTQISLTSVTVEDISIPFGLVGTSTTAVWAGTSATAVPSAGTSMVLTLTTGLRGRSFRGRVYLAGVPGGANVASPQTWIPGAIAFFGAGWVAMNTAFATAAGAAAPVPVVVSYYSGKLPNPNPASKNRFIPQRRVTPIATPVTAVTAKAHFGSQRRRNR